MAESGKQLKSELRKLGLSDSAIQAAWPRWWRDDADESPSARAELRFGVARRLGLDPRSLFGEREEPQFLWRDQARFKHLSGESELERAGIASFGRAVASILLNASARSQIDLVGASAAETRRRILETGRPYVDLLDLLSLAWAAGIPTIHLRVFPWPQKRMAAMTAEVDARWAILLAKDASYPAPIAFYVGHELGHIALGHLGPDRLIVDFEELDRTNPDRDAEEVAADRFALELLTGSPRPTVLPSASSARASGRELARIAVESADALQIEPGMLAQCFGYSTDDWRVTNAALKLIYESPSPVWELVNGVAMGELALGAVHDDVARFLTLVLGQTAE